MDHSKDEKDTDKKNKKKVWVSITCTTKNDMIVYEWSDVNGYHRYFCEQPKEIALDR